MKKMLLALSLTALLAGCFGEPTFDASNETTIKESSQKMAESMTEAQAKEFGSAIVYFTMGGSDGLKNMMRASMSDNSGATTDAMLALNIKAIDGLTAEEIVKKYKANLEKDRIEKEKRDAEQAKKAAERAEKATELAEIRKLKSEAESLLESDQFEKAIAKYEALASYSDGIEAAEAGMAKTNAAVKTFEEKMNYLNKVEITEFVAQRIDTYSKKGVPAVRIGLKNVGDRSLDKVKVVVYFHDKDGNTIYEKDYHPVLVSKYNYGADNKPLKAGYVNEMEKGNYYTLNSQLSEWADGKATAKVIDIEFSE